MGREGSRHREARIGEPRWDRVSRAELLRGSGWGAACLEIPEMATAGNYEPLHLKYRPQRFADVVGQGAVVQTLANAIRLGRVAPAYLFCGPRGTGKTSSARILAKSLNCEQGPTPDPCQTCGQCRSITAGSSLDVIEIDAASNTGVDNIRELIERAQFAPVNSRYKVYVIDECHMLSNAAFNALLKTLEEPPPRVVFVLATTDPQRVLPTIVSRCQRFDFRRIPLDAMVAHLGKIAAQEGIPITPEALQLVAQLSQGGLRDAERLLDQLSLLEGSITPEAVWDLVGGIPEQQLLALMDALLAQDVQAVLGQTRQLLERGKEPLALLQNLVALYRDLLLVKTAPQQRELVAVTDSTWAALQQRAPRYSVEILLAAQSHLRQCEPQIRQSGQPQLWLEIALVDLLGQLRPSMVAEDSAERSPFPALDLSPAPQRTPPDGTAPPAPAATISPSSPSTVGEIDELTVGPSASPAVASSQKADRATRTESSEQPREPARDAATVKLLRPHWDEFLKRLSPLTKALMGSGHLHQETPEAITLAFPSKGLVEKVRSKEAELRSVLHNLLQRPVQLNLIVQRSSGPHVSIRVSGAESSALLSRETDLPPAPVAPDPVTTPGLQSDSTNSRASSREPRAEPQSHGLARRQQHSPSDSSPPSPEPERDNPMGGPKVAGLATQGLSPAGANKVLRTAVATDSPSRAERRDTLHGGQSFELTQELAEIARCFADHFNGSLVDLEGVLESDVTGSTEELSSIEAIEAEGSPDLLSGETYGSPTGAEPSASAGRSPHPVDFPNAVRNPSYRREQSSQLAVRLSGTESLEEEVPF
ncbi:DNA polymerase III subunit gamma/tau [Thermostichus sp. MS-CIW-24]